MTVGRAFAILLTIPIAWFVFAETRKSYWDSRVRALCEQDAGIVIMEKAQIETHYIDNSGLIRLPAEPPKEGNRKPFPWEAKSDDTYFYRTVVTHIREGEPGVWRGDTEVVRAKDNKVLGRLREYGRTGGDAVVIDHHSSFVCPALLGPTNLYNAVFGDPKAVTR